jgi:hypothetical protein
MRIIQFFKNIGQAWSLIKLIREWNAIRASYPGLDDEDKLRHWLLTNATKLTAFAKITTTAIDDAATAYVFTILDRDETWKIMYNTLRLACGLRTGEAVYGTEPRTPVALSPQEFGELEPRRNRLLGEAGLSLTHEQLTGMAASVILAVVAPLQGGNASQIPKSKTL